MTSSFTIARNERIADCQIVNFRGIRHCEIADLRQVNLFIGKNNSGKSSILESLCFAKVPFKPSDALGGPVLQQLLNRRVQRVTPSLEEFFYNYQTGSKISLRFSFDNKDPISIEVTHREPNGLGYEILPPFKVFDERTGRNLTILSAVCSPSAREVQIQSACGNGGGSGQSVAPLQDTILRASRSRGDAAKPLVKYAQDNIHNLHFLSRTELIDHSFVNRIQEVERTYWSRMLRSRLDKRMVSDLNTTYGTEIESLTFGQYHLDRERRRDQDRYKIFAALPDIAMHIDDYGDGLRYAFSILTQARLSENAPLLIEEIESHQHPGAIRKLIKNLIEIAKVNNLQLFVTTHSFDVWRYFFYAYEDEQARKEEFRSFRVVRHPDTGEVDVSQEYNIQNIKEDIFEIEY